MGFNISLEAADKAPIYKQLVEKFEGAIRSGKLQPGEQVGILSHSQRFGMLMQRTLKHYAEDVVAEKPALLESDVEGYLAALDTVLVPKDYEKFSAPEVARLLDRFSGNRIDCYYKMDEGSVLYLEAKIKRLLEEKTI